MLQGLITGIGFVGGGAILKEGTTASVSLHSMLNLISLRLLLSIQKSAGGDIVMVEESLKELTAPGCS